MITIKDLDDDLINIFIKQHKEMLEYQSRLISAMKARDELYRRLEERVKKLETR